MRFNETSLRTGYDPSRQVFDFYLVHGGQYAADFQFKEIPDGQRVSPSFSLSEGAMQGLMDALWNSGVRPTNPRKEGSLEIMERHLNDMRAIAFSQLGVNPNGE